MILRLSIGMPVLALVATLEATVATTSTIHLVTSRIGGPDRVRIDTAVTQRHGLGWTGFQQQQVDKTYFGQGKRFYETIPRNVRRGPWGLLVVR